MYLSIYQSTYLPIYLSVFLSVHLSTCLSASLKTKLVCETSSGFELAMTLSIYLSIYLICLSNYVSIYISVCLSVCLSTCLSASLKTKLFCETSSGFELDNIKNAAFLRDFLNVWTWQCQKRSNSARLRHFSKLTPSKTKQFCETSFKNGKLSAELTASYQCILRFFHSICLNYCACHEKMMPGHTKCCACHAKSSQQTWRSDAPKCNPSREISARTSYNSSDEHVRLPRKMHLSRSSSNAPRLQSFVDMLQNPHVLLTFEKVHNPLRLPREATSEPPKVAGALCILTSKCASRHNGVHFFDIATSKSGPRMVCFVHVHFEMCFAPQRRALFRHLNFQKCSDTQVFLCLFISKSASRHNGVQFFISHLARWLRTRRFSEPTFRPSGATHHWKKQCFATCLHFRASASSFFWLFLFSDLLSSTLLFSLTLPISDLSILSGVWLNFLRLYHLYPHIVMFKTSISSIRHGYHQPTKGLPHRLEKRRQLLWILGGASAQHVFWGSGM